MTTKKITLALALDEISKAGFGAGGKYGSVDWRMLTGSNDAVGFTAWPTGDPAETRFLFEFSMDQDGMVDRAELERAIADGIEMASTLRRGAA